MSSYARNNQRDPVHVNFYRIGAIIAQILSFATTYAFVIAVMKGATGLTIFFIAAGTELLLALAKSAMFRVSKRDGAVGWAAAILDTLLNAGGLWPIAKNIGDTPTALMFAEALGIKNDVSAIAAIIIAIGLGFLLSVLPWYLWRAGDSGE